MTSRHRLIWDAIVTRFQGITTANGYNTNVRTVVKSPGAVAWETITPAMRPWIGVIAQGRETTALPGMLRIEATYHALCALTAGTEAEKNSAVDDLEDDILEAVHSDIHWGTNPDDNELNAVKTDLTITESDDIPDPRQGALIVTLRCTYYRKLQVR